MATSAGPAHKLNIAEQTAGEEQSKEVHQQEQQQQVVSKDVDSRRPFVVVFTGGPSSGKSSALALMRGRLTARGFQVLTVPENATHFLANSDGFQPQWAGKPEQVRMQRIFFDYQISQEEFFKDFAALHPSKRAVLLLDSCTLNSKVYLSDEQWAQVLTLPGHRAYTEEEVFARYDLVIHMVTCAVDGANYEWGPGSNNPGRYHNPEEAKETDERGLQVFGPHPQLRVVPHFPVFEEKIGKVLEFVNDALHIEGLAGRRCRRLCRVMCDKSLQEVAARTCSSASVVSCVFLDENLHRSVRRQVKISSQTWLDMLQRWKNMRATEERRLVEINDIESACFEEAAGIMYERRVQVRPSAGPKSPPAYLTRKVISEEDYYSILGSCPGGRKGAARVTKFVLGFLEGSFYYELFFFLISQDLVLDFGIDAEDKLPEWIKHEKPRELTKHDSTEVAQQKLMPNSATAVAQADMGVAKRRRVLRPCESHEAAVFGG